MKTCQRLVVFCCVVTLCSFFFNLGRQDALADPIPNCPMLSCLDVYAWYVGQDNNNDIYWSAEQNDNDNPPTAHTTNGIINIYGPSTNVQSPVVQSGNYYKYVWKTGTYSCDKLQGQQLFPSPQSITPGGQCTSLGQFNRFVCSAIPGGGGQ